MILEKPNIFNILFSQDHLPFSLFCKLREAGLPLQIQEYQDLLEILSDPANIPQPIPETEQYTKFYSLCQSLWVKSRQEKQIFQAVCQQFPQDEYIEQPSPTNTFVTTTEEKPTATDQPPVPVRLPDNTKSPSTSTPILEIGPVDKPPEKFKLPYIPPLNKPSTKDNCFRAKHYQHYRPATALAMQQTWHQLNYQYLSNIASEIDLPATINDVSKNADLFDIHLKPPSLPKTQLILLIDRPGSMIPFHNIQHQLQNTITTGGRLDEFTNYYFINSPLYLYTDPDCEKNINLWQLLTNAHSEHTLLLIFSDAGAARGRSINPSRVQSTKEFYQQVSPYFRAIAWLNPMPKQRWQNTSAGAIAQFIPMFQCDRTNFVNAIQYLQTHRRVN
jgi:uncharacterized protein with von Willebrand factor type A (vWA) domain